MPSIGRATAADGTDLSSGTGRHRPAGLGRSRGPRCCWSTAWASTPVATSMSATSSRAAGLDTHGVRSARQRAGRAGGAAHIERWSQYHDDLAERLAAVRARAGGRPVVLYGHSMGGLVVAGYLLIVRPKPDLVVLASPGLDSALRRLEETVSRRSSRGSLPTLADPERHRGLDPVARPDGRREGRRRPLERDGQHGPVRRRGTRRAGARSSGRRGRFGIPTLVLHGLDDGLVPSAASEVFEGAPGVERRTYPGPPPRAPQRTRGPRDHRRRDRLAPRACYAAVPQPNNASGERLDALRVWQTPQTRRT